MKINILAIFSCVLIFSSAFIQAQNPDEINYKLDSAYQHLKKNLDEMDEADKQAVIFYAHSLIRSIKDLDRQIEAAKLLFEKTELINVPVTAGFIKKYLMEIYFNNGMIEEFYAYVPEVMDYVAKNESWDYYFDAYYAKVLADLVYKKDEAFAEAEKLGREAREKNYKPGEITASVLMGHALAMLEREEEALDYYREAVNADEDYSGGMVVDAAYNQLTERTKDTAELLYLLDNWEKRLAVKEQQYGRKSYLNLAHIYLRYASHYIKTDQLKKAESAMGKAEEMVSHTLINILKTNYLEMRAKLYEKQGLYEKALACYDSIIPSIDETKDWVARVDITGIQARLFLKSGQTDKALTYYEKYINDLKELNLKDVTAQLDEIRTLHEVEKIEFEKTKLRQGLIYAIITCVLLLSLLVSIVYYLRKINRKNKNLVLQIEKQDQLKKDYTKLQTKYEETLKKAAPSSILDAKAKETMSSEIATEPLFKSLETYLKADDLFRKADLNRKELSVALQTNENYLYHAVKEATGMTLQEYLNSLRLEWAKETLKSNRKDTIANIAFESGFSSVRTFYRQFQETYHINPSEYRKAYKK